MALNTFKACEKVGHEYLHSILHSFGFPDFLCFVVLSFLSSLSTAGRVINGATFSFYFINHGGLQNSLLTIYDSSSSNSIYSCAQNTTSHSFIVPFSLLTIIFFLVLKATHLLKQTNISSGLHKAPLSSNLLQWCS